MDYLIIAYTHDTLLSIYAAFGQLFILHLIRLIDCYTSKPPLSIIKIEDWSFFKLLILCFLSGRELGIEVDGPSSNAGRRTLKN